MGAILNLQEDSDMAYFELDVAPIRQRCAERGDVTHLRYPIRDFDPFDLRMKLAGTRLFTGCPIPMPVCCQTASTESWKCDISERDIYMLPLIDKPCGHVQARCSWWRTR